MADPILVSGHLGLLARPTPDGVEVIRHDGETLRRIAPHEAARLFGRTADVVEVHDDLEAALDLLAAERTRNLAVRRLIMVLDPEEDEDIAERAATRLEELLDADPDLSTSLEDELSAAPLPEGAATDRWGALAGARPNLAALRFLIVSQQDAIARNRQAFEDASLEAGLAPETVAPLLERAIASGLFRQLLQAAPSDVPALLAGLPAPEPWMRDLVAAWRRRLPEAPGRPGARWLSGLPSNPLLGEGRPLDRPPAGRQLLASLFASVTPAAIAHAPRAFASGPPPGPAARRVATGAPAVSMQQLIEAGAHFGHQTHRWNPKMKPYIFGDRNGVHILDLAQTVPLFARALEFVSSTVATGGKVLFVGTKRQAQEPIAEAARRAGQHFVNHRWLGGMLTQWKTIAGSIKRLKVLEERLSGDTGGLTKKEVLNLARERDRLEMTLGGIRDMGGVPDVMFVIDANKEALAIREANMLGIPVVAILDSNVSPDGVAFPIPANDDATRAIRLYCEAMATAASRGRPDTLPAPTGELRPATDADPADEPAPESEAEASPGLSPFRTLWPDRG